MDEGEARDAPFRVAPLREIRQHLCRTSQDTILRGILLLRLLHPYIYLRLVREYEGHPQSVN